MLISLMYRLYQATARFSVMGYRQEKERVIVLDWFGRTWEWR